MAKIPSCRRNHTQSLSLNYSKTKVNFCFWPFVYHLRCHCRYQYRCFLWEYTRHSLRTQRHRKCHWNQVIHLNSQCWCHNLQCRRWRRLGGRLVCEASDADLTSGLASAGQELFHAPSIMSRSTAIQPRISAFFRNVHMDTFSESYYVEIALSSYRICDSFYIEVLWEDAIWNDLCWNPHSWCNDERTHFWRGKRVGRKSHHRSSNGSEKLAVCGESLICRRAAWRDKKIMV